jgi:hypothetical protein
LNNLIHRLSILGGEFRFEEKWLIAPSLRVARQWLDRLALCGGSVLNFRPKTIKALAIELAGPEIASAGYALITGPEQSILIHTILKGICAKETGYFKASAAGSGLAKIVTSSIQSLRMAGVTPDQIKDSFFDAPEKASDLREILDHYTRGLRERALIDYSDVFAMASKRIVRDRDFPAQNVLIVTPDNLDLSAAEKELLKSIPSERLKVLETAPGNLDSSPETDLRLLRFATDPAKAPDATGDGTVRIFRAIGEANEVRHALAQCLSAGLSLDEVELLHTDYETYAPLIYETFAKLTSGVSGDFEVLPVTFAEGIPARYSRPARAIPAFFSWIESGYTQEILVRMIQEGLLEIPDFDSESASYVELAGLLKDLYISFGLNRYVPKIQEKIAQLSAEQSSATTESEEEDPERARSVRNYSILLNLAEKLGSICPKDASFVSLLKSAAAFLDGFARAETELDNYVLVKFVEDINQLLHSMEEFAPNEGLAWSDWLTGLALDTKVAGSGPRPGRLHVDHVLKGGHSGRKYTFIIGLDDTRFPGGGSRDPLLLDAEREKVSDRLTSSAQDLNLKLKRFAALPSMLRGTLTLGFSCHNVKDDREMFPSPVLFSAYRILSNNRTGDQRQMLDFCGDAASFAPYREDECLDESRWWLRRICEPEKVANIRELVWESFPHLERGDRARMIKGSEDFTEYDGNLGPIDSRFDPYFWSGPSMSAAKLETMGRCPKSYFYKYLLKISPPRDLTVDFTQWLTPPQVGELLHQFFHQFMKELMEKRRKPRLQDIARLRAILTTHVDTFKAVYPPPNESALRRQVLQLERVANIFLTEEEQLCRSSRPIYLETPVGMRIVGADEETGPQKPVRIPLGDKSIRATGVIDRIDESEEGGEEPVHWVWDYKSGSSRKYEGDDPFNSGRIIQHALYLKLAQLGLKLKTCHFGYFFPGEGARGIRIRRYREDLAQADFIISSLCKMISEGCFLPTNVKDDCRYCDYRMICGDADRVASSAKLKLSNPANDRLKTFKELRKIGSQDRRSRSKK